MEKRGAQPEGARRARAPRKTARPAQPADALAASNTGLHLEPPSDEDIRVRAYHRYLERGAAHGSDFDDWVEAEKDLKLAHN
jgi:hypothetical protein